MTKSIATFAAGCFWGVEATFSKIKGVTSTCAGYTGGSVDNPNYQAVCSGTTGHAEAIQIGYDPEQISYQQLLDVFWDCHDPTQLNRQGLDLGRQYRSAIFYHNDQQRQWAEQAKQQREQAGHYTKPIATEITAAGKFYRAEEYHQRFLEKQKQND